MFITNTVCQFVWMSKIIKKKRIEQTIAYKHFSVGAQI